MPWMVIECIYLAQFIRRRNPLHKKNNNNNSNGVHTSRSWIYDHKYIASVQESDAYLESVTKGPLTTEKLRRYPQKTWYGPHNVLAAYTNNNGWQIGQKVG